MAEIGDKSFTTDMIQLIKDAVKAELGTNAYVNRYLAEVTAVNTTTSEVSVKLSGSDSVSDSFRARGIHLPSVGEQVIACIDGQDRWIESVVRPTTSTPYLQIASGSLVGAGAPTGAVLGYLFATPPSGWLLCNGGTHAYNTYPALGALFGAVADGSFILPDMRNRFIAGLGTVGTWSNTTGTFSPNTPLGDHSHTFTGDSHSHDIAHDHADDIAVSTHGDHAHTVNPDSVTSAVASVGAVDATQFAYIASGATYRQHTHTVNVASTTSSAETSNLAHTVTGGVTSLGTTNVSATQTGTLSIDDFTNAETTAKSTLINFIIKT